MRRTLVGALLAASVLTGASAATAIEAPAPPVVDVPSPATWPDAPADAVGAQAYVLMEAATGQVLAERDGSQRRPVASTVKILTALTVIERAELTEQVTVGDEVAGVSGSGVGLVPGQTWTVEQLLDALIARSGNDAAEALAVHVAGDHDGFIAMMRDDLTRLGLDGVTIVSPSGLDDDNRLSARDLGTIARAALSDPRLRPLFARQRVLLPSVGRVETRNLLLTSYEGATGLKTGFTEAAGNSLVASATRDGRELIAVLLGSGEDPARFEEAATLLDLGFEAYRLDELTASLRFAVAGGAVLLEIEPTPVTVPQDLTADLRLPLTARPPAGDVEVEVLIDQVRYGTVPGTLDEGERPVAVGGGAAVGRAAVDGAYAALRAAAATGVLR
jgi:D-alanyl-D-alanine carboxypeptidase